jgi:GntR family transcriptional regulator/MocR family aminotransferase
MATFRESHMTIIMDGVKTSPPGLAAVIAIDRRSQKPLHRQVYEGYRDAIIERRLRPGQRLPSTRSLSTEMGISRVPVISAFEQLLTEGYIESRVGSGSFVARSLPEPPSARPMAAVPAPAKRSGPRPVARIADALETGPQPWAAGQGAFRLSLPALDQFPTATWARLMARHARGATRGLLAYGSALGYLPLRETLAAYLRTSRAVRCEPEQILVVSGSQQALALCARVLLEPGDPVWVEEPGYSGACNAFLLVGARLVPVPVDDEGLDVAAGVAQAPRARVAYVTPAHQHPLGMTMSAARRLRLLEWARASGSWIIEDDYDSEYRYESLPVGALQGADRDARVLYIGTFSKVLYPSLRIGYLVVPPDLVDRFARVRDTLDIFPPTLPQAALTDFLVVGHYVRHLRRMRRLYAERRNALVEALDRELGDELEVLGAQAGMHLVAQLRSPRVSDREIAERAAALGVSALPLSTCYLDKPKRQGFVLGFSGTGKSQLLEGVRRLRSAMRSQ